MQQKILAITGIRSEYDLLYPLLSALDKHPAFELKLVVSGAHLSPLHNYSINEIIKDGFCISDRIESLLFSNTESAKVKSIGELIKGLAQTISREQPDYLMVLGDREETIATAMTGSYMRVPVIHLAGGDSTCPDTGDVDEEIRHATTKLSHVHLTMTDSHGERIKQLGEQAFRIFTVGNGGLDRIRLTPHLTQLELSEQLNIPQIAGDYAVFIYHPLSSYAKDIIYREVEHSLRAALDNQLKILIGASNSDPGFMYVQEAIDKFSAHDAVAFYGNLPRLEFVNLLRHAQCLVGNSSLGIHEAGFLGLPVINVGARQKGRETDNNVQFVDGQYAEIYNAIQVTQSTDYQATLIAGQSIYGDGHMADNAMQALLSLPDKQTLLAKLLTY